VIFLNYTENLGLKLPEAGDSYNIEDMNYNTLALERRLTSSMDTISSYNIPTVDKIEGGNTVETTSTILANISTHNTSSKTGVCTGNVDGEDITFEIATETSFKSASGDLVGTYFTSAGGAYINTTNLNTILSSTTEKTDIYVECGAQSIYNEAFVFA
jgi:hypothetical protein